MTAIFSLKTSNLLDFSLHSTKMFDLQINSDLVFETNFRSCTIFDLLWKKCMKDQSYRGNMHFKFQKTILSITIYILNQQSHWSAYNSAASSLTPQEKTHFRIKKLKLPSCLTLSSRLPIDPLKLSLEADPLWLMNSRGGPLQGAVC